MYAEDSDRYTWILLKFFLEALILADDKLMRYILLAAADCFLPS